MGKRSAKPLVPMTEEQRAVFARNTGLVYKYVLSRPSLERRKDDCLQSGFVGLIKASQNFKEEKGVAFSTYATQCIRGEILRFLERDRVIQLPPRSSRYALADEARLKLTPGPIDGDWTHPACIPSPSEKLERAELSESLRLAMRCLTPGMREAIESVFYRGEKDAESAKARGVRRQTYTSQRNVAKKRMREFMTNRGYG